MEKPKPKVASREEMSLEFLITFKKQVRRMRDFFEELMTNAGKEVEPTELAETIFTTAQKHKVSGVDLIAIINIMAGKQNEFVERTKEALNKFFEAQKAQPE